MVGDDGSVWSKRPSKLGQNTLWKQQKPTSDGLRMVVNLTSLTKKKTYSVNRLVLLAFKGPPPAGMEGCHNDGNHRNNKLANLRWDTHSGNERDKERHGTGNHGERNRSAKLTIDQVREIRQLYASGEYSYSQLARIYGITVGTTHSLVNRNTWRCVS